MAASSVTTEASSILTRLEQRKSLMSVKDVAEITGMSNKSIYRRVEAGTMPFVKFGYTVKFDPHQVARWMRDHYAA